MTGFNLPFGPMDPASLPALLRQQMASPGLISGPVPPVQLTSGFRPPGVGGMGGMATPQPEPGFNVKDGLALLREGLEKFRQSRTLPNMQPAMAQPNQYGMTSPETMQSAYFAMPNGAPGDQTNTLRTLDFLTGDWLPKGGFSA